jgi:hypothetical protein
MVGWEERRAYLLTEARQDLEVAGEVRPCLLAFQGTAPLLVAYLRAHDHGRHLDALFEVLTVAAPLGADRLALSLAGRAWSLHDPIAPVIPGLGDLRQRVLCIEEAVTRRDRVHLSTAAIPYHQAEDGTVTWLPPIDSTGAISRVATTLAAALHHRGRLAAPPATIRRRALHCTALGHLLALATPAYDRLGLKTDERAGEP